MTPEEIDEYWGEVHHRFTNAASAEASARILAEALCSDMPLTLDQRRVFASMLLGEWPCSPGKGPKWRLAVIRRRDEKQANSQMEQLLIAAAVAGLVDGDLSVTEACRQVSKKHNRTQRSVEIIFKNHKEAGFRLSRRLGRPRD